AVDLRFVRSKFSQNTTETERLFAERGPHPVFPGGRRVTLIEHKVEDLEYGRQTRGELRPTRNLERDMRLRERPFGPDDALGNSSLRDEERTGDLRGRQTSKQAQRERHAGLGRENRMTGREHEAQKVVAHVIVDRGVKIRYGHLLLDLKLVADLLMLALQPLVTAQEVDGTMFRGGHQPSARIVRDARLGPLLKRGDESILRELLGEANVAHDAREASDEPRRLDPPDRVDYAMCIGSRHFYRSQHLLIRRRKPTDR